ncbi:MAG: leucyl aminopeptidase [Phycisphaerales bacterium]|nr:leucyl aminopeptidase [Phycisphaerales bacterium]
MAVPTFTVSGTYRPVRGDFILLPYRDSKDALFDAGVLPEPLRTAVRPASKAGGTQTVFRGVVGQVDVLARSVRLDGVHVPAVEQWQRAVAKAVADAEPEGAARVVALLDCVEPEWVCAAQEGALLGGYAFDRYLKEKANPTPVLVVVAAGSEAAAKRALGNSAIICRYVNQARDVLNEPPNVINPVTLAREFARVGAAAGLRVSVWDDKRLARERCGALLAVGQGAVAKPRLVIGDYQPRAARGHLCLVGKGITYDTGGYGLKPADAQVGMKYDMGGAAAVFAAACAIAELKLPLRVTVLTPLAENAVSGEAYLTTSILTTRSGRTVEVHHTDAEGRLILADALALAVERRPDWIVDAATLTGACMVALGEDIAGVYGNEPRFTQQLIAAGRAVGELYWELPLHAPYEEHLKATVADGKNIGVRWGGSITAALFLQQWITEGQRWIHCDIAGPGCKEEPLGHLGKGAKGFGVKTFVQLASALAGAGASPAVAGPRPRRRK